MKRAIILIAAIAFTLGFAMCNTANKEDKKNDSEHTAESTSIHKDKHDHDTQSGMADSSSNEANNISKTVEVKGDVEYPFTFTVDSLKKMKVATIENFNVVCQSGANMKVDTTCRGVLLKDILEKAKIVQQNHKDRNFYIVARATDNYKATFSWAEIFNNPTGENVYVLFEENGQPIKEKGDMILISKNDIKTGPRHVYWLKSIEVHRVD